MDDKKYYGGAFKKKYKKKHQPEQISKYIEGK